MGKRNRIIDLIFLGGVFLFLAVSLVRAVLLPKDINVYENRYSDKISPYSSNDYLSGQFQDDMESGLADQIPGAQYFKRFYNLLCSFYTHRALNAFGHRLDNCYVTLGDKTLYNGFLVYTPASVAYAAKNLDEKAASYSTAMDKLPELDFYFYYIERDRDINFATGEKSGLYEYLCSVLPMSAGHAGRLRIDSFEDYSQRFYATDHHWNNHGSYQGYTEILAMLLPGEKPLLPLEELRLGVYSGTKAAGKNAESWSEDFMAYRFAFPDMSVRLNGEPVEDYGRQTHLTDGALSDISYVGLYGMDAKELVFDTGSGRNGSLLIIGESNDNAIVKLLASHFDSTFSVDLRHYATGEFKLDEYTKANDIDKVLFVGNSDFYTGESFLLG